MRAEKQIKIDLQIKRKRDELMSPDVEGRKIRGMTTKSSNGSRGINVTIHNKQEQLKSNNQSRVIGKDGKKVVVSEFQLPDTESNWNLFPRNLNLHLNRPNEEVEHGKENIIISGTTSQVYSSHLRQEQKLKSIKQKKDLIALLEKKQAQIRFYEDLFEEKQAEHKAEEVRSLEEYQRCIESLITAYQKQVQKNEYLKKLEQEQGMEREFQRRRELITLDGKMGLNYSPKQLSTFSGMSGTSILLQSLQQRYSGGIKRQRSSLFSFGSSNKLSRSRSAIKQAQFTNFLNPGRAMFLRGKRITFD